MGCSQGAWFWKITRSANRINSDGIYYRGTKVHITVTSQWYVFPLDICCPKHISPVKCIPLTREHISLNICVSRVGKHISLGRWVRGKTYHGETHITVRLQRYVFPRNTCFPKHIPLVKFFPYTGTHVTRDTLSGKHISRGTTFP